MSPPRRRTLLIGLAVALLLAAAVAAVRGRGDGQPPASVETVGAVAPVPEEPVIVHVTGAVREPGVYALPRGSRVVDAIERAGGITRQGNAVALNLASLLADGEQVLVPELAPIGAVPEAGAGYATGTTGLVHLNGASVEDLDALPGIGPATAERIIAWRDEHGGFSSVEQLVEVPGIGPAKLDQLRDLVAP
ncbi:MAG: ComEA family DNA-binding protein [Actinobacteria bacterium]|nr:ComEA family DNA-binding protein [Actinomycetota bacterium]